MGTSRSSSSSLPRTARTALPPPGGNSTVITSHDPHDATHHQNDDQPRYTHLDTVKTAWSDRNEGQRPSRRRFGTRPPCHCCQRCPPRENRHAQTFNSRRFSSPTPTYPQTNIPRSIDLFPGFTLPVKRTPSNGGNCLQRSLFLQSGGTRHQPSPRTHKYNRSIKVFVLVEDTREIEWTMARRPRGFVSERGVVGARFSLSLSVSLCLPLSLLSLPSLLSLLSLPSLLSLLSLLSIPLKPTRTHPNGTSRRL